MATLLEKFTRRLALFIEFTIVLVLLIGAGAIWMYRANRLEKDPQAIAQIFESQERSPSGTAYWKEGNAPIAIVFVPGMFASKDLFSRLRPFLGQAFTLYGIDLAGFGYTRPTVAEPNVAGWTSQLHQFLNEMKIREPILVGQGEGADVIQTYAAQYPVQVRSLVLIGRSPILDPGRSPSVGRSFLGSHLSPLLMPALSGRLLVRGVLKRMMDAPQNMSRDQIEQFAYPLKRPNFWEEARRAVASYQPVKIVPSVPVEVIYGINDSWSPLEPAKQACDQTKNCRFHFLMDAGHLPQVEQPQAFSRLLANLFLP